MHRMARSSWLFVLLLLACAQRGEKPSAMPAAPTATTPTAATPSAARRLALYTEGRAAYARKDWASCAELLEQAGDWYNAACCRARLGQLDPAFAGLQRALDGGWRDASHLQRDSDLQALHADPRWAGVVAATQARADAYRKTVNAELLQIFEADQADRTGDLDDDWNVVSQRDAERERRVEAIVAAGGARVSDDYYHAAMVYQHGGTQAHAARAHELALKAVELDPNNNRAKWLAAAAEDRRLMYENKPQKYGTQFVQTDGVWRVWEVDPSVTDEERAKWNVPPLADTKQQAAMMNAAPPN